jgi:DNA-binding XRE family transcriptional regulator
MVREIESVEYTLLPLAGVRYAVLTESALLRLCRAAGVAARSSDAPVPPADEALRAATSQASLAHRLRARRRRAGLSQAALAQAAGIRAETLNRLERGHTTPDFSTVRKLIYALRAAARGLEKAHAKS